MNETVIGVDMQIYMWSLWTGVIIEVYDNAGEIDFYYIHFRLNCLSNAIVSFKSFLKLSSGMLESYSIPYPFKYLITSNLCKVSTSSSLVIGGNPYSSAETPSGNIMEVQPDEELFDDVVEGWASLVES